MSDGKRKRRIKLGIFGGSFNPVHLGHVQAVQLFKAGLRLDQVIVLPSAAPFYKTTLRTEFRHRVAMCRLAFAYMQDVIVSDLEKVQPDGMYTRDIVMLIHDLRSEADLYLLMGSDVLNRMPQWKGLREMLKDVRIGVLRRNAEPDAEQALLDMGARITFIDEEVLPFSSSMVRETSSRGNPIEFMVPESVAGYIRRHGLYMKDSGNAELTLASRK
jgi:nicotinate-nucleotide adenylyltransferase